MSTILVDGIERPTLNHVGKKLAKTVSQLKEFWCWFGDSAIVDGEGRPLVVYHGSETEITRFDTAVCNEIDRKRLGAYFTSNPKLAGCYGDHVHAAYLAMPKLFDVAGQTAEQAIAALPVTEHLKRELRSAFRGNNYSQYGLLESALRGGLRPALEAQGYSGIRYTEGDLAYIAFDSEQIRLTHQPASKMKVQGNTNEEGISL